MDSPTKYIAQLCFVAGSTFQIPLGSSFLKLFLNEMEFNDINLLSCCCASLVGAGIISLGYITIKKEFVL